MVTQAFLIPTHATARHASQTPLRTRRASLHARPAQQDTLRQRKAAWNACYAIPKTNAQNLNILVKNVHQKRTWNAQRSRRYASQPQCPWTTMNLPAFNQRSVSLYTYLNTRQD